MVSLTITCERAIANVTEGRLKVKEMDARGERPLSTARSCRQAYQESLTLGRTGVPSTRTAYSWLGSKSSAFRMVGATCAVPTTVLTVLAWKDGLDSSRTTLVSSWANPPCSASFALLPEYVTPTFGVTMMSGVRGSTVGSLKLRASDGP